MSGDSTQGVGAALCAPAAAASAISAAAVKTVLVESLVILHSPATDRKLALAVAASPYFEQITNANLPSRPPVSVGAFATLSFHDSSFAAIFRFQSPLVFLGMLPWGSAG